MSNALWYCELQRRLNEGHSYDAASDLAFAALRDRHHDVAEERRTRRRLERRQEY
jgi:hypothetical protein